MLGLLVVTHGRLAEELVASTEIVVGKVPALEAVSIDWNDDADDAATRISEARERVDDGEGVLVLTDMFGGTPTNLAFSLHEPGRLEIVTGVNLPMLIKFTNLREEMSLGDAAEHIAEKGRESIQVASLLLSSAPAEKEEDDK